MLRRTVRRAIEAGPSPVVVVLGRDAATLAREVGELAASIVINHQWETGMASSLTRGLETVLAANPDQTNVMVLVCDQPGLDASILRELMEAHVGKQSAITASSYSGTLGVPAIFSRPIFPELMQLTGDQGARRILQRHLEEVASVDFPGGEFDLDTPNDLARLNL